MGTRQVGLPISHDMFAGEYVCWNYLTVRCSDVTQASQALAEHGRCAHRLQEQARRSLRALAAPRKGVRHTLPRAAVAQRVQEDGMSARGEADDAAEEGRDEHWLQEREARRGRRCGAPRPNHLTTSQPAVGSGRSHSPIRPPPCFAMRCGSRPQGTDSGSSDDEPKKEGDEAAPAAADGEQAAAAAPAPAAAPPAEKVRASFLAV